jgi:hypothetical protein
LTRTVSAIGNEHTYDGTNATLYVNGVADVTGSWGAALNTVVSSQSAYIGSWLPAP